MPPFSIMLYNVVFPQTGWTSETCSFPLMFFQPPQDERASKQTQSGYRKNLVKLFGAKHTLQMNKELRNPKNRQNPTGKVLGTLKSRAIEFWQRKRREMPGLPSKPLPPICPLAPQCRSNLAGSSRFERIEEVGTNSSFFSVVYFSRGALKRGEKGKYWGT